MGKTVIILGILVIFASSSYGQVPNSQSKDLSGLNMNNYNENNIIKKKINLDEFNISHQDRRDLTRNLISRKEIKKEILLEH